MGSLYSKQFYEESLGVDYTDREYWSSFFGRMAKKIVDEFNPKTVLDAGCASGYLVEALRDLGVQAYGVDISEYAISIAREDIKGYLYVQSLTDDLPKDFPKTYDLVVTIEVLEHLYADDGKKAIEKLCTYSDTIIFTSTPYDLNNKTHVNVQQREYWVEIFARNSFYRDLIQKVDFICPHAMLFKKDNDTARVLFRYELANRVEELQIQSVFKDKNQKQGCVYFNLGSGYLEENRSTFEYQGTQIKTERIRIPNSCIEIRIDVIENAFCVVQNIRIGSDIGNIEVSSTNSEIEIEDTYFFTTMDSQIICNIENKNIHWIEVTGTILVLKDNFELEILNKALSYNVEKENFEENRVILLSERDKALDLLKKKELENEVEKKELHLLHEKELFEYQKQYEMEQRKTLEEIKKLEELLEEQNKSFELEKKMLYLEQEQALVGCQKQYEIEQSKALEEVKRLENLLAERKYEYEDNTRKLIEEKQTIEDLFEEQKKSFDLEKQILWSEQEQALIECQKQYEQEQNIALEEIKRLENLLTEKKKEHEIENEKMSLELEEFGKLLNDEREKLFECEKIYIEKVNLLEKEKQELETFIIELEKEYEETKKEITTTLIQEKVQISQSGEKEKRELVSKYEVMLEESQKIFETEKMELCNILEKTKNDLETYQQYYFTQLNECTALKVQLEYYMQAFNQVSTSQFWKITAPCRKIMDIIKKILKSNRVTYLFCKGLISLKNDGIKKTWEKIQLRNEQRKNRNKIGQEVQRIEEFKEEIAETDLKSSIYVEEVNDDDSTKTTEIKFSILVPLYNTPKIFLREMIQSVMAQTYGNWELCLADGSDDGHAYVEGVVRELQKVDERIKYKRLEQNLGISENTNNCAKMATGDYLGFLDHDDLLAPNALMENVKAINETMADVLYSDEDHLSMQGEHVNPFFKPDWSPDLLYSQMYICHFTVVRHELFQDLGGFRSTFDGSQDYDLLLRLSEITDRICHIPFVLYTWRECEGSTAANADAKPYAHTAGRCALDEHLKRKYGILAHAEDSDYTFVFEPRFDNMLSNPLISIIIPMKDKWELTDACVHSILEKSTYQNYEIIILDNRSIEQKTMEWFKKIQSEDKRIRVVLADMEFNWSKLNNFGISQSKGEVYVFLNNDTLVITPDWLERLSENALRKDIGAVGALLLYEDNTIQHAGVVVGFGGWADHVFKGMSPIHYGAPFVSPMVSRNVLAVTGACMAISKHTIEKIGLFDEEFIICGSDVEICVRAYEQGLFNRYDANVRLYHLESKSRDSYIPEIDFKKSYECYTPYRENIDPFFNINLDINSVVPRAKKADMNLVNFRNFLKRCPLTVKTYQVIKRAMMEPQTYNIPEIGEVHARKIGFDYGTIRINLLVPSVDKQHVFGGIATAINFFEELRRNLDCAARIITLDAPINPETSVAPEGYCLVKSEDDSAERLQIVAFSDRYAKTIPVEKNDIFVATGWWTAYVIREVMYWQKNIYDMEMKPLIYLIQDYEPGFYAWSSRYLLADSTYRMDIPTWAVMNSSLLRKYFQKNDYNFAKVWHFEPVLNAKLSSILKNTPSVVAKKKQILVYGRPSVERNAFSLLVTALQIWCAKQENVKEWTIYSAGEQHDDVDLGNGMFLKSVGKLTIEEYAMVMLNTYAGVSLMVSPHPSYPPLEMSTFGIRTITNCYSNKDLSDFNENIISLKSAAPVNIANVLCEICNMYCGQGKVMKRGEYIESVGVFDNVIDDLIKDLKNIV